MAAAKVKEMGRNLIPYACLYIDATFSDLVAAYASTFTSADPAKRESEIAKKWTGENVMVSLSVRTALDLYLQVHNFPAGSQILMTAINIPDMSVVLRHHKLVPVPVDIDPHTFLPRFDVMERLVTPKTVAICAAHIFGRRFPLQPIFDFAKKHKLLVIEDCAEAFSGFENTGDVRSDISLFSFGSIKVATAFGAGICRVRDASVFDRMKRIQSGYETQTRSAWFQKVVKNTPVWSILNLWVLSAAVQQTCYLSGIDHKPIVVQLLRGFPDKLIERLRTRPSPSLINFLHRRITTFDKKSFKQNTEKGHLMSALLDNAISPAPASSSATSGKASQAAARPRVAGSSPLPCLIPGKNGEAVYYWLYPVVVTRPNEVIAELNKLGVDAYRGATQLALVPPPPEWKSVVADAKSHAAANATAATGTAADTAAPTADSTSSAAAGSDSSDWERALLPVNAQYLMDHLVYLPVHKYVPDSEIEKMARTVRYVLERYSPQPPQFPVVVRSKL